MPQAAPEPLSPADTALLVATTPDAQLQIGALCRFEGGPLRDAAGRIRLQELRRHVASRLVQVPRFRQRIQHMPLDLARPVWIDDAGFDIDRHVRATTLAAPGGPEALRRFVARLLGQPLDMEHPPWDLWAIDAGDDGEVVVVLRTHHVVADGISLFAAATALLDLGPALPDEQHRTEPWRPAPPPTSGALTLAGLAERARSQLATATGAAAVVASTMLDPRSMVGAARAAVDAVTPLPRPAPRMQLSGRVARRRDFVWSSLPLEPLRDAARASGVTLNDLLLAAVTGAVREVIGADRASTMADNPPRVLVPVGDTVGDGGNGFSFVVTELPVHLPDPTEVLAAVHHAMRRRKESGQSDQLRALFAMIDVVPIWLLQRLAPEALARQPFVNLAVTNVPGADVPLYLRGARLLELHPIVTGVGNLAVIVGVISYGEELGVGITVDPDVVPDADGLLQALLASAGALASTAG